MDERLSLIFARRSIRAYTGEPVGDAELQALLEAAMAAPSGNDRQPWRFVAVRERARLNRLAAAHPYGKMLAEAPLGIAVCGDPAVSDWWVQDCSAAAENLLLAAGGLGLGGVWIGCFGRPQLEKAVRDCLSIPEQIGVLCLVSIGHPAERKEPRTQYERSKVRSERW